MSSSAPWTNAARSLRLRSARLTSSALADSDARHAGGVRDNQEETAGLVLVQEGGGAQSEYLEWQ